LPPSCRPSRRTWPPTHLANPRRVVRAPERARIVGDRLPDPARYRRHRLDRSAPPRLDQDARISPRDPTVRRGPVAEAVTSALGTGPPRAFAFGYFEALAVADGEIDEPNARATSVAPGYARRQATWFRSSPVSDGWRPPTSGWRSRRPAVLA
jgi:tRNA A37 N6-isopentenylltransferase MiaA